MPNPGGWHSLMDQMHGTMGVVDFCPDCLSFLGIGDMLTKRARDRAVGVLKQLIPVDLADMREAIGYEGIVAAIEAGEYDDAFDSGDGINLAAASEATRITDAELVPQESTQ